MRKIIIIIAILLISISVKAQDSRFSIGGGIGGQFGNNTSGVTISPQVGYNVSKYLTTGVGVGYTYQKDTYRSVMGDNRHKVKTHYANMNVFARFYPIQYIVLSVQPEMNRMWSSYKVNSEDVSHKYSTDKLIPSVLVGGGVRFGPMTAMIQYDVVQDKYTPYSDKIFYSVGYTFSL